MCIDIYIFIDIYVYMKLYIILHEITYQPDGSHRRRGGETQHQISRFTPEKKHILIS
jgi:hypothetical protein